MTENMGKDRVAALTTMKRMLAELGKQQEFLRELSAVMSNGELSDSQVEAQCAGIYMKRLERGLQKKPQLAPAVYAAMMNVKNEGFTEENANRLAELTMEVMR